MKTWQAFLTHMAVTAAQAAVGVPFTKNQFANTGITLGAQFALTAIQGWVAKKNSNTDPAGQMLLLLDPENQKYISISEKPGASAKVPDYLKP